MTFYSFFRVNIQTWPTYCIWLIGPPNLHSWSFSPFPAFRILLLCLDLFYNTHHILTYYKFYFNFFFKKVICLPLLWCQIAECQHFIFFASVSPNLARSRCFKSTSRMSERIMNMGTLAIPVPKNITWSICE